jgi:SAM-dependent methyltransferase
LTDGWLAGDTAQESNDLFAPWYDEFNHRYQYEGWTKLLLQRAQSHGGLSAAPGRLLDVACGTGLSFLPMLDRGWTVTACDVSPTMAEIAAAKAGDRAGVCIADMRELPILGEFDLVWAVNDAINYLLSEAELFAALRGMAANLAVGGRIVFDVNTLETYRTFFAEDFSVKRGGREFVWHGRVKTDQAYAGMMAEARFAVGGEVGSVHVHHQRHFPENTVLEVIANADLACLDVGGQWEERTGLITPLDEERHSKAVYVAGKRKA